MSIPRTAPDTQAVPAGTDTHHTADPRAFLDHFPTTRRSTIANWHHYAARRGAQTAAQVVRTVQGDCTRRLAWGEHPDALLVQQALATDPAGALAYAE